VIVLSEKNVDKGLLKWTDFLKISSETVALAKREEAITFEDIANIQFTSGTTGYPKAVTLTHHNILNNA